MECPKQSNTVLSACLWATESSL